MTNRQLHWQLVRGVVLVFTGFFAATGMASYCAVRNVDSFGATDALGRGPGLPTYLILAAIMLVWIVLAGVFAWRNRNPSGYLLSGTAFAVFAANALNVITTAYPACNAF